MLWCPPAANRSGAPPQKGGAVAVGAVAGRGGLEGRSRPGASQARRGAVGAVAGRRGARGTRTASDDEDGGAGLVVSEVDAVAVPEGPANPAGNAWTVRETDLLCEAEAQRVCDASVGRHWKIKNPASTHPATGE